MPPRNLPVNPNCLDKLYNCMKFDYMCIYKSLSILAGVKPKTIFVLRFMEQEFRPSYVGTRLGISHA